MASAASRKLCTKKDAAQIIKRALQKNIERKYSITLSTESTVSTLLQGDGTNWYNLCSPAVGNTAVTRIGNQIRLQKLEIKGSLHNNGTISNLVRMIVFYLKDNVAVSSATDIFETGSGAGADFATTTGIDTMHWPLNKAKLDVVYDTVINLAKAGEYESTKIIRKTFNLRNRLVQFEGNTQGIDNQEPNLYLLYIGAEAGNDTGVGTTIEQSHYTRCWYTDA